MNFTPDTVKGFEDYLPPISLLRKKIMQVAEKNFKNYGFLPIETPIIEYEELLKGDSLPKEEDEAVRDRFKLQDRAGRKLGLRYEFTFQLARIFSQNPNIKLPFKRSQIGPVFRDEPIKQGRTRQFTQCDIDIIGDSSVEAETECLAVMSDILKELEIKDTKIEINNRKLMNAILESVKIENKQQALRELDKLTKLGEDEVQANLRKIATPNQIVTLFKLLGKDLKFYKENAFDGAEELEELIEVCNSYKIKVEYNPTLMRGFAYYTGNVFEIVSKNGTSILGGGRFDNLVGKYSGKDLPAVGFSLSVEALIGLCPELENLELEPWTKAIIIQFNEPKAAITLAGKLRKSGISCIMSEGKPSQALDYANSYNIPYAIFLGEDEVEKKKFTLKDLDKGEEKLLSEKQLIKALSR